MKRILAMVLVMMMVFAMPAMAEAGKMATVTINNVEISMGTDKNFPLGFSYEMSAGGVGETDGVLNVKFSGADSIIANVTAAMENGEIKLGMDGLSNNYSITEKDLTDLMQSNMPAEATAGMPFTQQELQEVIDAYVKAIEEAAASGKEEMSVEEGYAMMGLTKGDAEDVIIHEQTMNLPKYQGTLKAEDLDRMIEMSYTYAPSMKDFMEKYIALVQKAAAASGEEITFDADHMFSTMFKETGMDITVDLTVWADDAGDNMRLEMTEHVTAPAEEEGAEPQTISVPFVMEISTSEAGQYITGGMTMGVDDTNALISFEVTDKQLEEGVGCFGMLLIDVNNTQVNVSFNVSYNADGAGDFDMALTGPTGEALTMNIHSTGGEVNTHRVALGVVGLNPGTDDMNDVAISFDMTTSESEMPAVLFDDKGKPTISIMEMTDADMQLIQQEAQREAIIMFGKIMSDRGLSEMVSYFTASMQSEIQSQIEYQVEQTGDENPVEEAAA